jgi:hypothetical protein
MTSPIRSNSIFPQTADAPAFIKAAFPATCDGTAMIGKRRYTGPKGLNQRMRSRRCANYPYDATRFRKDDRRIFGHRKKLGTVRDANEISAAFETRILMTTGARLGPATVVADWRLGKFADKPFEKKTL